MRLFHEQPPTLLCAGDEICVCRHHSRERVADEVIRPILAGIAPFPLESIIQPDRTAVTVTHMVERPPDRAGSRGTGNLPGSIVHRG